MKYSANQGRILIFVVGRAGSKYGLPVAVYKAQYFVYESHQLGLNQRDYQLNPNKIRKKK